jgi:hypothetical protein
MFIVREVVTVRVFSKVLHLLIANVLAGSWLPTPARVPTGRYATQTVWRSLA